MNYRITHWVLSLSWLLNEPKWSCHYFNSSVGYDSHPVNGINLQDKTLKCKSKIVVKSLIIWNNWFAIVVLCKRSIKYLFIFIYLSFSNLLWRGLCTSQPVPGQNQNITHITITPFQIYYRWLPVYVMWRKENMISWEILRIWPNHKRRKKQY